MASSTTPDGRKVKLPQGNWPVLRVLRSPLHRLLDGSAVELSYVGRRSGKTYALPLQYARTGNRLVLAPQGAESKTWWRNFMTPRPVTVRLRGAVHQATAQVVRPGDPSWEADRAVYAARWKRQRLSPHGPLVAVTFDSAGRGP